MPRGVSDIEKAIVIAAQIEDDALQAEAHLRVADLFMIQGHASFARSHALYALRMFEGREEHPLAVQALQVLMLAFYKDDEINNQMQMALPYAERLLKVSPDSRLASAVVSRFSDPRGFIEQLRQELAKLAESNLSIMEQDRVGRRHAILAGCLADQGEIEEAIENFTRAAQYHKKSGNEVNYVDTQIRKYKCFVENKIPIDNVEAFIEMLQSPLLEYQPALVDDVIRILEKIDRPELATRWDEKRRIATDNRAKREHERAETAAAQYVELEAARRELVAKIEAEQSAAWLFRLVLGSAFLLFGFLFLTLYSIANRKALRKLEQEVEVREAAQAKNEELAQQLLHTQKLDALGTLSAGIAHDFNNTLQAVTMLAEVVKDAVAGDSASQGHLDTILEAAEQGSALTRGMLVFSGKHETIKSNRNIIKLARETVSMVKHMIPASITIELEVVSSSSEILVNMNDAQIKQVLLNLVINAKDAMPDGGTLSVHVSELEEKPNLVQLVVSDSGNGMSDDVKTKMFEPFFTTKDRGRGTGLGMSMTHGIVEDHGGTIEVESELGVGTTVTILLTRVRDEQNRSEAAAGVKVNADGDLVLLTEDNEHIRSGIRTKLEQLGFQVYEAEDGPGALQVYAGMTDKPDLVLMDVDLPGLAGPRCLEALREKGSTAPVIFITGLASSDIDGVVLSKPFNEAALVTAIREVQESIS